MMYDYVNTKPPLNEETLSEYGIIEHGWLKDQASKVHKYISRKKNELGKWIYTYKQEKAEKDARKAKKQWNEKGRKKVYKKRKSQIRQARVNADRAYRTDSEKQYKVRQKQVKAARKNAHDINTEKKKQQHYSAFESYYARKGNILEGKKTAYDKRTRAKRMSGAYNRRPGKGRK